MLQHVVARDVGKAVLLGLLHRIQRLRCLVRQRRRRCSGWPPSRPCRTRTAAAAAPRPPAGTRRAAPPRRQSSPASRRRNTGRAGCCHRPAWSSWHCRHAGPRDPIRCRKLAWFGGTEHSSTDDRSPMSTPISSVGVADSRFSYQGFGLLVLEAAVPAPRAPAAPAGRCARPQSLGAGHPG